MRRKGTVKKPDFIDKGVEWYKIQLDDTPPGVLMFRIKEIKSDYTTYLVTNYGEPVFESKSAIATYQFITRRMV